MLAIFCLRLACGLLSALLLLSPALVNPRFYRTHFLTVLGLTTTAALFLREASSGNETTRDVDHRIKLVKRESERQVLVESREGENWVHRSVVKK